MENSLDVNLLQLFQGSVSNNLEDVKESEKKLLNLYNDPERESYIKFLWKYIMYPYDAKNEPKNVYDKYLNKNVKVSILISIKNYIIKNVHSNLEDVQLSADLCIFIKHMCMHALLDSTNEETRSLEKYYFEILFHLFKYNICDDYDFLIFYILILYVSDSNIKNLYEVFNTPEKKNTAFVASTVECIMLYIRNREIVMNLNQNNFTVEFNKLIENIERIKIILLTREGSLNDDVMSYVGNTKKVYKTNDKYNIFCFSDLALYNMNCENLELVGNKNNLNKYNYSTNNNNNVSSNTNNISNTSSTPNAFANNNSNNANNSRTNTVFSNTLSLQNNIFSNSSCGGMEDFEFVGKGKLLDDFNDNVKIVSALKHVGSFKNANILFFKKKYLALKILKKILQNYNDYSYTSKYDLKIILTHIDFPLTLYFVYIYNKFKEYNNFIIYKVSSSDDNALEDFNMNREMAICFVLMNDLIVNMCILLKIFYKINVIDLPEYHEDNMEIYFNIFYNIILYEVSILKQYFTLIDVSKTIKTGLSITVSSERFIANTSGMNYATNVGNAATTILSANDMEINSRLTYANLQKLKRTFEKNLARCKTLVTDILKVYAEKYQVESKMYVLKFVYSLAQLLYKESDKDLLCHNYNCFSSTIRLLYHTNLERNPLNPFKNIEFIQELLETVLSHIKLKQGDVDEILDADLEYFRNDLNNADSYSLRSTATSFLKTLSEYYKEVTMEILQNRILPTDNISIMNTTNANTLGKSKTNRTNVNNNTNDADIPSNNSFFNACNLEYKVQLINCLGNKELAHEFYSSRLKDLLNKFINSLKTKYVNLEQCCHNINSYCFEVSSNGNIFINNINSLNRRTNTNDNSTSLANNGSKMIWLSADDEIFSAQNNIYILSILKFLFHFKEICNYENIRNIFDFLDYMLYNEKTMIHNYACLCINKVLNQKTDPILLNAITHKVINSMLSRLLFLLKYDVSNRILNEYILITILRIFIVFPNQTNSYYMVVLSLLNDILNVIVNDIYNPMFNHYLFELLTVLVSLIYKSNVTEHIQQTESCIINTFAVILQQFIHDFIPYIFQILSIIIENSSSVQDIHVNILANLYQLDLWKSSIGNANGIMCVLKSFFKKYNLFQEIIKNNMQELFNIYYYCLSNKKLTMDSFQIILTIFMYLPIEAYLVYVKPLLVLLFNFLQQYKNDVVKIKVIHALSVFVLKTNADIFVDTVEQIQTGLILNVIRSLYMNILDKIINFNEKMVIFIALSRIINHARVKNDPLVVETLECLNKQLDGSQLEIKKIKINEKGENEEDDTDKQFEVAYVKLHMIHNENINELILKNINVQEEFRTTLLNECFMPVISLKGLTHIMNLMNN